MIKAKKTFKKVLYMFLFYTKILQIICKIQEQQHINKCLILFYHRFRTIDDEVKLLPRMLNSEFEKQIRYLKDNYDVITLDEAVENINTGKAFQRPSIVITIDDGYKDNYFIASPILEKYDVKPTIFLAAGVIGTRECLWLDSLECALLNATTDTMKLPEIFGDEIINVSTVDEKRCLLSRLYCRLLPCTNFERQDYITQVFKASMVTPSDIASRERVMLSWAEVREMASSGTFFGAHTLTHPFLPILPVEEAQREIIESRIMIQNEIGRPVKHFAIPNGARTDFTDSLRAYCRDTGFASVLTTEGGSANIGDDTFQLKRVLPPPPMYYFACEIAKYFFFGK